MVYKFEGEELFSSIVCGSYRIEERLFKIEYRACVPPTEISGPKFQRKLFQGNSNWHLLALCDGKLVLKI